VQPGHAADLSPPSSAAVMEEQSYSSTHSPGHTRPVMGSLYLYRLDTFVNTQNMPVQLVDVNSTGALSYDKDGKKF